MSLEQKTEQRIFLEEKIAPAFDPFGFTTLDGILPEPDLPYPKKHSMSLGEVIDLLHYRWHNTPVMGMVELVIGALEQSSEDLQDGGNQVIIGGSDAKKILGGLPIAWDVPMQIWKGLVQAQNKQFDIPAVRKLLRGGDDNINFKLTCSHEGWGKALENVRNEIRAAADSDINFNSYQMGGVLTATVNYADFHVDLGPIAINEDDGSCRQSLNMPPRESYSVLDIGNYPNRLVTWDTRSVQQFFIQDWAYSGVHEANLGQSLSGLLRSMRNGFWWPPRYHRQGGNIWPMYEDQAFWIHPKRNVSALKELTPNRKEELLTDALLLITCNPHVLSLLEQCHYLDYVEGEGVLKGLNVPVDPAYYHAKFLRNEIPQGCSGPELIAASLSVPVGHMIDLLRIRDE